MEPVLAQALGTEGRRAIENMCSMMDGQQCSREPTPVDLTR